MFQAHLGALIELCVVANVNSGVQRADTPGLCTWAMGCVPTLCNSFGQMGSGFIGIIALFPTPRTLM